MGICLENGNENGNYSLGLGFPQIRDTISWVPIVRILVAPTLEIG